MTEKDFALRIFKNTRKELLYKTDWIEVSVLTEDKKNEYRAVRQFLRDCTATMTEKMEQLGYICVTDAWVKETIREMIKQQGLTLVEELQVPETNNEILIDSPPLI